MGETHPQEQLYRTVPAGAGVRKAVPAKARETRCGGCKSDIRRVQKRERKSHDGNQWPMTATGERNEIRQMIV